MKDVLLKEFMGIRLCMIVLWAFWIESFKAQWAEQDVPNLNEEV